MPPLSYSSSSTSDDAFVGTCFCWCEPSAPRPLPNSFLFVRESKALRVEVQLTSPEHGWYFTTSQFFNLISRYYIQISTHRLVKTPSSLLLFRTCAFCKPSGPQPARGQKAGQRALKCGKMGTNTQNKKNVDFFDGFFFLKKLSSTTIKTRVEQ
jgi:hypothetical protein